MAVMNPFRTSMPHCVRPIIRRLLWIRSFHLIFGTLYTIVNIESQERINVVMVRDVANIGIKGLSKAILWPWRSQMSGQHWPYKRTRAALLGCGQCAWVWEVGGRRSMKGIVSGGFSEFPCQSIITSCALHGDRRGWPISPVVFYSNRETVRGWTLRQIVCSNWKYTKKEKRPSLHRNPLVRQRNHGPALYIVACGLLRCHWRSQKMSIMSRSWYETRDTSDGEFGNILLFIPPPEKSVETPGKVG